MARKMITKEQLSKLDEKKRCYYSLSTDLEQMARKLSLLNNHRKHSSAFQNLRLAIEIMQEQVNDDYNRYVKNVRRLKDRDDVANMQHQLNRERAKRQELEKQIKMATESSGLFIKFVRQKLGV